MSESRESERGAPPRQAKGTMKKPYQKPSVRYERVFETSALICGKVQTTQRACAHNRKSS